MNRILALLLTLMFIVPINAFASGTYYSEKEELNETAKKVLQLVKEGNEDEAANLPEVQACRNRFKNNPALEQEYFSSLKAVQAMKENFKVSINKNESKIIEFDDGSFIKISATTTNTQSVTRDPGDLIYSATDHYQYEIWGLWLAAKCDLYTDYDYGNYYVKITDVNATQKAYTPAWSTGCSSTIVSSTRAKGTFNFQDPAGSFGAVLITDLTAGPFTVDVEHTKL